MCCARGVQGQYDRVHVGASCPPDRLAALLALLRPTGGVLVTPVAPSDLRIITKRAGGAVEQKTISQVRYSDLEVRPRLPGCLAWSACLTTGGRSTGCWYSSGPGHCHAC